MQSFAIIPAAGLSKRMGSPKLLMPWGQTTLIDRVLSVWRTTQATRVIAIVRKDDQPLIAECRGGGAEVVMADSPPPQMKDSVALGLKYLQQTYQPAESDVWLLAPADLPSISASVIDRLLNEHDPKAAEILVPTHRQRTGHPVLFPWSLACQVEQLPDDRGVNELLKIYPVRQIECGPSAIAEDVDTPADYRRLSGH